MLGVVAWKEGMIVSLLLYCYCSFEKHTDKMASNNKHFQAMSNVDVGIYINIQYNVVVCWDGVRPGWWSRGGSIPVKSRAWNEGI